MSRIEVAITTPDGAARAFTFTPSHGDGPWPAVIFYMDAPAIRTALFEMSQRLADLGYFVLLPDMFWRGGPYDPIDITAIKTDEDRRAIFGKFFATTSPEKGMSDTGAFLDFLSAHPQVKGRKVGATGYCMGGAAVLRAAGTYPDRIVAGGAFHGGGLATDAPDSPHLLIPKMRARILVAGADEDRGFDDTQCARLDAAFKAAGVEAEVTIYRGAKHGYAPPDMPVYDVEASERHWRELTALLDGALKAA